MVYHRFRRLGHSLCGSRITPSCRGHWFPEVGPIDRVVGEQKVTGKQGPVGLLRTIVLCGRVCPIMDAEFLFNLLGAFALLWTGMKLDPGR
jgi:hypothetical protein